MTIHFGRNVLRPFKKDGRCDPLVTLNCRPIGFGHSKVIDGKVIDGRQRPSSDQYGGSQVSIFLVVDARNGRVCLQPARLACNIMVYSRPQH
jgi:hypothetical protein